MSVGVVRDVWVVSVVTVVRFVVGARVVRWEHGVILLTDVRVVRLCVMVGMVCVVVVWPLVVLGC